MFCEQFKVFTEIKSEIEDEKCASIMLTMVSELLTTISENEFEDLDVTCKAASSVNQYGLRLRIKNMQTQYLEMKKILRPQIQDLLQKFKKFNLQIETRSKVSPGEVIEAIEFKLIINKKQPEPQVMR